MEKERTVLVTGFGPFDKHDINASWEAAKELYKLRNSLRERYNVNLIIENVPVVYDYVLEYIPRVWKEHKPELVLHVGLCSNAKCVKIEQCAHGTKYSAKDVEGKCPSDDREDLPPVIETKINLEELCRKMNEDKIDETEYRACVSSDAGLYLCGYIYYQSLIIDPDRTLFVHVPDLNVYSSSVTARALYDIIKFIMS